MVNDIDELLRWEESFFVVVEESRKERREALARSPAPPRSLLTPGGFPSYYY
jgi:hypothetical protein